MSLTDHILSQVRKKELKLAEIKLNLPYLTASIGDLEAEHGISMIRSVLGFQTSVFIEKIMGAAEKKVHSVHVPIFSVIENGYHIDFRFINTPQQLLTHKSIVLLPAKGYNLADYHVVDISYTKDKTNKKAEQILFLFDKEMTELSIYYVKDKEEPVLEPVFFQTLSYDLSEMLANSITKVVNQFESLLGNFQEKTKGNC